MASRTLEETIKSLTTMEQKAKALAWYQKKKAEEAVRRQEHPLLLKQRAKVTSIKAALCKPKPSSLTAQHIEFSDIPAGKKTMEATHVQDAGTSPFETQQEPAKESKKFADTYCSPIHWEPSDVAPKPTSVEQILNQHHSKKRDMPEFLNSLIS